MSEILEGGELLRAVIQLFPLIGSASKPKARLPVPGANYRNRGHGLNAIIINISKSNDKDVVMRYGDAASEENSYSFVTSEARC